MESKSGYPVPVLNQKRVPGLTLIKTLIKRKKISGGRHTGAQDKLYLFYDLTNIVFSIFSVFFKNYLQGENIYLKSISLEQKFK